MDPDSAGAGPRGTQIELRCADGDVVEAVAVEIAGAERAAQPGADLVALRRPLGRGGGARCTPWVVEGAALVGLSVVKVVRADEHIAEAVTVRVARARHGDAEVRVGL